MRVFRPIECFGHCHGHLLLSSMLPAPHKRHEQLCRSFFVVRVALVHCVEDFHHIRQAVQFAATHVQRVQSVAVVRTTPFQLRTKAGQRKQTIQQRLRQSEPPPRAPANLTQAWQGKPLEQSWPLPPFCPNEPRQELSPPWPQPTSHLSSAPDSPFARQVAGFPTRWHLHSHNHANERKANEKLASRREAGKGRTEHRS